MLDLALETYRQLENRPDGTLPPGAQSDILTVRFTVRLKGTPAIDLDRSRQTFAFRINTSGPVSDRSRQTPIDLESYSHSNTNGAGNPSERLGLAARRPTCTVRTTDTLMRSSIGAGFRAICAGCTFRDLSRSIGLGEGLIGSLVPCRRTIASAWKTTVTTTRKSLSHQIFQADLLPSTCSGTLPAPPRLPDLDQPCSGQLWPRLRHHHRYVRARESA
jgi:hypothetical protein